MDQNQTLRAFTWKIENFSTIQNKKLYSNIFYVGGNKWQLVVFPKGNNVEQLSVYLDVADSETFAHGWSRYAQFRFTVLNQLGCEASITKVTEHKFNAEESDSGFISFMPLTKLNDPNKGYLVNDACLLEFEISTDEDVDLESIKLIDMPRPLKLKTKADDSSNQEASAQNLPSEAIKLDHDLVEEDMDTFFTSLESELECVDITPSLEAAKEALAKIEEALNMPPSDFDESGKFSPIKKALKVLSSALPTEQKSELLQIEKDLDELAKRVVKAAHDKYWLTEKESMKLTLYRNLEHSLNKFKEAKAEVKQAEVKIAEAEKKKGDILVEQKEIFKISKKLKTELEALRKEWAEYEAKAKAAEEEEKTVLAEWGRMRDFVASIKGKI